MPDLRDVVFGRIYWTQQKVEYNLKVCLHCGSTKWSVCLTVCVSFEIVSKHCLIVEDRKIKPYMSFSLAGSSFSPGFPSKELEWSLGSRRSEGLVFLWVKRQIPVEGSAGENQLCLAPWRYAQRLCHVTVELGILESTWSHSWCSVGIFPSDCKGGFPSSLI